MQVRKNDTSTEFKFTKFGAWDFDVRILFPQLSELVHVSAEDLYSWIYSDGVLLFQKVKADLNRADHCKDTSGITNVTTARMMALETALAFEVMLTTCAKKFTGSDIEVLTVMNSDAVRYFGLSLTCYTHFYEVQAAITTEITKLLNANPAIPREEVYDLVVNKFSAYKNDDPVELSGWVDDHLTLMREFSEYMKSPASLSKKPGLFAQNFNGEQASVLSNEVHAHALKPQ